MRRALLSSCIRTLVKTHPWLVPWLVGGTLAASALACAAQAQPVLPAVSPAATRPSLAQAIAAAWQRSIEATQSQGQQRQAQADQTVASSWLAAPPALQASQRQGRGSAAEGQRETELGVALPVWRIGARATAGQAAQAELEWAQAAESAARLRLAGQVRETQGQLAGLESEHRLAALQNQLLQRLAEDVDRRVKAGDLAPADAMATRAEWLASQAQEAEVQQKLRAQQAQWQWLTGLAIPAEPEPPRAASGFDLDEAHPELQLAARAVERAQRKLSLAQVQRGDNPELGVHLRQERPGQGMPTQSSVGVSLRLPFGTDTHAQPRIAAALTEVDLALTQQQRIRDRLAAELQLARTQLQAAESQAQLEAQRAMLLRERAGHIEKAFKAGESPLPELLRALGAAAQAEAASERQQAHLRLAQARLQQAQGLLP
ncbi:TolC family protein [Roseateles puraquae]|jgi:outer membrane protein, heavy metal efflux system|uniref:Transporter n=1 Tax=Roseateles puraquae TaxID=431059 RepID=A0A254NG68_9BURK|nr:TolC family protein [Roseateles puraquae]OWR04053.1 transporter [Roseateles puraquae]